ncbi:unnamed protein product [Effrenium voratum]|uniref:Uncharacterized protein n=1 Tax=Effrenium voratum TaxID=2562239 RepID=A0AA36HXI2_9DINO|nr:unnamed protein product [Effrenium voratum]
MEVRARLSETYDTKKCKPLPITEEDGGVVEPWSASRVKENESSCEKRCEQNVAWQEDRRTKFAKMAVMIATYGIPVISRSDWRALLGCGLVPLSAFALHWPPACCWAFLTALFEALQFLSSRTLADALLKWGTQEQSAAALLAALLLKGTCILCIMHCQQMGFQAELSRFVGIFMVATNLLTVVLSLAFFGDQVEASWSFLSSATSTLVGIWLLNCPLTLKRDSERGPDTPE